MVHHNLLDLQRAMAYKVGLEQVRELQRDGYGVDADRLLDELIERKRTGMVTVEDE